MTSLALLERVSAGELDGALRIWRPVPALVLGRMDARHPGAAAAIAAAERVGLPSAVRQSGGRAVVLGPGSLAVGIAGAASLHGGLEDRYRTLGGAIGDALAGLGLETTFGELEGEWCPGAWSLVSGGVKLAGISQRVILRAAWTEAVLAVSHDAREVELLREVYGALDLPLDTATVGSVEGALGRAVRFDEIAEPIRARLAPAGARPELG